MMACLCLGLAQEPVHDCDFRPDCRFRRPESHHCRSRYFIHGQGIPVLPIRVWFTKRETILLLLEGHLCKSLPPSQTFLTVD